MLLINDNTLNFQVSLVDCEKTYATKLARDVRIPRSKNIFLNALKDLLGHKKKCIKSPCMAATLYTDLFNLSRFSHVFQIYSPIQHITITNLNRHFTFSTYCIKCRSTHTHPLTRYSKREINIYGAISLNYSFALGYMFNYKLTGFTHTHTHLYLLLYLQFKFEQIRNMCREKQNFNSML